MGYEPEVGQACFGNRYGDFGTSEIGEAAVFHLLDEMARVYWNHNQKPWEYAYGSDDPGIPGITFRPYWWGADDAPEVDLPNLVIDGVDIEVRWYKYPGRGMTTNREVGAEVWSVWLEAGMELCRKKDAEIDPR